MLSRLTFGVAVIATVLVCLFVFRRPKEKQFSIECNIPKIHVIDSGKPGPCIGIVSSIHGNEPAGAYTLSKMLASNEFKPKQGKLVIIPQANPCGLQLGVRENPYSKQDTNRQFSRTGGHDIASKYIIHHLQQCDLILDFHEGWGFHLKTKASWNPFQQISDGSTLTPGDHTLWKTLAPKIVNRLNVSIRDPLKKFSVLWNNSCNIKSSLNCYAHLNGRLYLLIETTGQNNIQPLSVRENQIRTILLVVFQEFGLI